MGNIRQATQQTTNMLVISPFTIAILPGLDWDATSLMGALEIAPGDITHAVATNIEVTNKTYYGLV
jgi:hypothetical protein